MSDVRGFWDALCLFFFPRRCAVCGEVIPAGDVFCPDCSGKMQVYRDEICLKCGNPKNHCECKSFLYHFAGCAAPFLNRDAAQQCVYNMKFSAHLENAWILSRAMAACVRFRFPDITFDLVCCVPMYKAKERERGYNQSDLLARGLAKLLRLRYDRNCLRRVKAGKTQHTLNARQRFDQTKGLYACRRRLSGMTVLLVDDIKTTGATLDECARQLRLAGAAAVYCVTALITA